MASRNAGIDSNPRRYLRGRGTRYGGRYYGRTRERSNHLPSWSGSASEAFGKSRPRRADMMGVRTSAGRVGKSICRNAPSHRTHHSTRCKQFGENGKSRTRGNIMRGGSSGSPGTSSCRNAPSHLTHHSTAYKQFEENGKSRARDSIIGRRYSLRTKTRAADPLHRRHHSAGIGYRPATASYCEHPPRRKSTKIVHRKTNPMGIKLLTKIKAEESNKIICTLYENKVPLRMLLKEESIDHGKMQLLVSVLSKACKGTDQQSERLNEIMDIVSDSVFLGSKLLQWISSWTQYGLTEDSEDSIEINLSSTTDILFQILTKESNRESGKVSAVGTALHVLRSVVDGFEKEDKLVNPAVKEKFRMLQETHSTFLRDHKDLSSRKGGTSHGKFLEQPPDDFRKLPILPVPEELQIDYKPFLRKNIVNGDYRDVDHYLDIQYRLLREDFIAPLREGIAEYIKELKEKGERAVKSRFHEFRLYNNVKVLGINPSNTGLGFILHFDVENYLKKVKWERSKRLIYGSLVCLSKDDFKTLIFGVVTDSDPKNLRNGFLTVAFDLKPYLLQELFNHSFQMAESASYFEAYRHVLSCLQEIKEGNLPFSKYIIKTTCKPDPPLYAKNDGSYTTNVSNIGEENFSETEVQKLKEISVNDECAWSYHEELGLDESQMRAYEAALQEEVCIIQGPPGTGKTYVGLRIVKTLLQNREKWSKNKPLLVICYTNHALDQFLEGILKFQPYGVVRIGGRSANERMHEINISQVRRKEHRAKSDSWQFRQTRREMRLCADQLSHYESFINISKRGLLKYQTIQHVMSHDHRRCITRFDLPPFCDPIAFWLRILDEDGHICAQDIQNETEMQTFETSNLRVDCEDQKQNLDKEDIEQGEIVDTDTDDSTVTENEELERRYIDEEEDFSDDDFSDTVDSDEMESPEDTVVSIPKMERIETFIKENVLGHDVMTEDELTRILDIWRLNYKQRWSLYRYWVQLYIDQIRLKMHPLYEEYNKKANILRELRLDDDFAILRGKFVIGLTTTGAAKQTRLLRAIGPPIVVVEEAAEILEAHVITSLSSNTQHLIMIGDHQQLRPNPTVYKLCKEYKLDVSLFERLIKKGMPHHRLSLQHRMRPEISHLLRLHKDFYPGLLDHEMVFQYENILGIKTNLFFVEHDMPETHHEDNKSRSNLHEARYLMSLCKYLLLQGYNNYQITILTAYKGQVHTFRQIMDKSFEGVRVCPIDNFQGEENDIILFSFVRSNVEGSVGFLKVSNRVCVALSRAKKGFYCIGNFSMLSQQSELWATIVSNLRDRKLIGPGLSLVCRNHPDRCIEAKTSEDFTGAFDGGCDEPCAARLDCGHTCQMKCHPTDQEHREIRCERPCEKTLCNLKHVCPLKCWEGCPPKCSRRIVKKLPCSHEQQIQCYENPNRVFCNKPCERELPCGHACLNSCGSKCTSLCQQEVEKVFQPCGHKERVPCSKSSCPRKCTSLLKCEHACQGTCGTCTNGRYHERCSKWCKRILVCGHICKQRCSQSCPPCSRPCEDKCVHNKCRKTCGEPCVPCRESCKWKCRHHRCTLSCGIECNRKPCNRPCSLRLRGCEHKCIGLCGEPCPRLCRKCDKADVTVILFGNEDNPHARFVLLRDCKHIVEVEAMDRLMKQHAESEENAIKLPECPWCRTPIRYNERYNNIIKAIKKDVEKIKIKIKGQQDEIESMRFRLRSKIEEAMSKDSDRYFKIDRPTSSLVLPHSLWTDRGCTEWSEFLSRLMGMLDERRFTVSLGDLGGIETLLDIYHKLQDTDELKKKFLSSTKVENIKEVKQYEQFRDYFEFLQGKIRHFYDVPSEQEIFDWQNEHKRCKHILSLLQIVAALKESEVNLEDHDKERKMIDEADLLLSDGFPFDADKDDTVRSTLGKLKDWNPLLSEIGISETERQMVVRAMEYTRRGHWFKCRNGHVYTIGDCGGAMQRSQCPECQENIGGASHRLDEGNEVASEMDGARFAAYSEEANNMLNFDLDNID